MEQWKVKGDFMEVEKRSTVHKRGVRKLEDITLAVVHYTGSMNFQGTLNWFGDERSKVSAQYVINRDGDVVAYDDLYPVMWHCGKSEWEGTKWCNRRAVGYELVGTFDSGFTDDQMDSLTQLLYDDIFTTRITSIVGHEHISPGRKVDPGPEFNWSYIRACHKENPFRNMLKEPITHIGSHPVHLPKKTYEEEVRIESGKDAPYVVWRPMFFK
jgi:N-acetyl-anhydromuramyl-L-alanine amidase AmpD